MDEPVTLEVRLTRIETLLEQLVQQRTIKDLYTIAEAAKLLGKSPYTVRSWANDQRINATKRASGRGRHREWAISHEEVTRIQNHGLLRTA